MTVVAPHHLAAAAMRNGVEFTQLSPTVFWMHTSYLTLPKYGPFPAIGLIIIDGATAILINSGWTDTDANAVVDWAEQYAGVEISKAFFTHSHIDKMGGIGAIQARGIATYAIEISNQLAISQDLIPAEGNLPLVERGEILSIGPVEFYFPGPGHSADNIVVNIKASGILFGGCLIRPLNSKSLGNTDDADIDRWAETVEAAATAFPSSHIVVPTHGPAGRTRVAGFSGQIGARSYSGLAAALENKRYHHPLRDCPVYS